MAGNKNDWRREQARRRRDILELKALEENPAPKKPQEDFAPKTLKEKLDNFWYHNKAIAIAIAAVVVVLAVCIGQIVNRPKYDCQVVLYLGSFVDKATSDTLKAQLEKYCPDKNGDGEVNVLIVNCCVYEHMQTNQLKETLDRVSVQIMSPESTIFIVDDETIKQLDNTATELFEKRDLPHLSGRGVNIAEGSIGQEVKKADVGNTIKGDYYITARHYSENSAMKPTEEDLAVAKALIDNILAETEK